MPRRIERFEVVAVPYLLLEIFEYIPKARRAERITLGGRLVDPPSIVFIANAWHDVVAALPGIIAGLANEKKKIFIVKKSGSCPECRKNPTATCPHSGLANATIRIIRIDY